ncbi:hypothetical protein E2562_018227, partial [Oryza meyeriana var. granulata]
SSSYVFVHLRAARLCHRTGSSPQACANECHVGHSCSWRCAHCGVLRLSRGHLVHRPLRRPNWRGRSQSRNGTSSSWKAALGDHRVRRSAVLLAGRGG